MNKELKPCPFCDEPIKIENGTDGEGFGNFYIDHCCEIEPYVEINLSDSNIFTLRERWNTRT